MSSNKVFLISIDSERFKLPNLGLWSIKAYLNEQKDLDLDVDIEVQKASAETLWGYLESVMKEDDVLAIGFQLSVWSEDIILKCIKRIKTLNSKIKIIVGGSQVSTDNYNLIQNLKDNYIDFAVIGQGEIVFHRIIKSILTQQPIDSTEDINYDKDLRIISHVGEPIYYFPYRDQELFNESLKHKRFQLFTSIGCVYKCSYCNQTGIYKAFQIDNILKDLSYLFDKVSEPVHIDFLDATFILNKGRAKRILQHIIDLNTNWTWHAEINIEQLDNELISLLHKANFTSIEVGLQSIHPTTLNYINRGFNKDKFVLNAQKIIRSNIKLDVNTIIGLPNETIDQWLESIDFCYSLGNVDIVSSVLRLLPKSKLFESKDFFGYETENTHGKIKKSNTMSKNDVIKAELLNKLVHLFWNDKTIKIHIRNRVETVFQGRLSNFLNDLLEEYVQITLSKDKNSDKIYQRLLNKIVG